MLSPWLPVHLLEAFCPMSYRLAIDIGNSRSKFALFAPEGELRVEGKAATEELETALPRLLSSLPEGAALQVGWASVAQPEDLTAWALWASWQPRPQLFPLDANSAFPIESHYRSPATLGTDRLLGVIGARQLLAERPVLVIDAGTALTYDLATAAGVYLGGAIAPGLRLRLRALHVFTARLPLVEPQPHPPLIGDTTERSLLAGAATGMAAEIDGMIDRYRQQLGPDLQVFLTGGDGPYFEKLLKNQTFADASLILSGIHHTLTHVTSV